MVSEKIYVHTRRKRICWIVWPFVVFDFDDNGKVPSPVGASLSRVSRVDFFRLKIVRIMFLCFNYCCYYYYFFHEIWGKYSRFIVFLFGFLERENIPGVMKEKYWMLTPNLLVKLARGFCFSVVPVIQNSSSWGSIVGWLVGRNEGDKIKWNLE
jgi:hypothetical protein